MSSAPSGLPWSTVDAALRATHALHQMEQACLIAVSGTQAVYLRVSGPIPELVAGLRVPRARCLPARMLDGAAAAGSRADQDPALADTVEVERFGVHSHVSMPLVGPDGAVLGIITGLDRSSIAISPESLGVLRAIADSLGASDALRDQLTREARFEVAASNGSEGAQPSVSAQPGTSAVPAAVTAPGNGEASGTGDTRGTGDVPGGGQPPTAPGEAGPGQGAQPGPGTGRDGPHPGHPEPSPESAAGNGPRVTPEVLARAPRPGPAARPGAPRPAPPKSGPPRPGVARGPGGTAGPGSRTGSGASDMRLRRASAGWIVEGPGPEVRPVGDLVSAMVLADLLAEDLSPPGRPRRADRDLSETEQLRLSVIQLEHALASRVIVEQAIGVLAERNHIKPRDAFERLRRTARGMGRRVHDLARQVVESVGDPRITLPGELGRGGATGSGPGPGPTPGSPGSPGAGPAPGSGAGPGPGSPSGSGGGPPRPSPPRAAPSRR
ncbi:response regulator receiver protein [Frankia sp. CcI49]|uniref:ANTAR domain-containing protein n=2 Tax=unclassified Frankia TaxID=2632575 RepID=UPI0006CA502D|nr:ANTAR domain-containing protein [Frankia sp. R43]ONH53570.1 response regulator receiver protein [Frankia sp. CcI49]